MVDRSSETRQSCDPENYVEEIISLRKIQILDQFVTRKMNMYAADEGTPSRRRLLSKEQTTRQSRLCRQCCRRFSYIIISIAVVGVVVIVSSSSSVRSSSSPVSSSLYRRRRCRIVVVVVLIDAAGYVQAVKVTSSPVRIRFVRGGFRCEMLIPTLSSRALEIPGNETPQANAGFVLTHH